jgi:hypothetical protein
MTRQNASATVNASGDTRGTKGEKTVGVYARAGEGQQQGWACRTAEGDYMWEGSSREGEERGKLLVCLQDRGRRRSNKAPGAGWAV